MRLKHVVRRLLQLPLFTTIAVATLALGIGANSAIFSVVEGVLLKPLAYPESDRLVAIDTSATGIGVKNAGAAPFLYFTYRDEARTLTDVGLWRPDTVTLTGRAEPQQLDAVDVTERVLPALRAEPAAGRRFSAEDDLPGRPGTAILSYGLWRSRFGGDPAIVGQSIVVDGEPRTVVGVMPAAFRFLDQKAAIFLPMQLDRNKTFLGNFSYQAIGRLAPGADIQSATAEVARLIPIAISRFPVFPGYTTKMFAEAKLAPSLAPLKDRVIGEVGSVLWVLMATIGLVLLIACANVANLLLVRAESRQQELAIRAALGAGWGQIARELLAESLTLAAAGGVAGIALAYAAVRLLRTMAPANLPRLDEITIDAGVLLFTAAIAIVAGFIFGSIPVFKYIGPHLASALRSGGRGASQSRDRHRARSILVVVQVALALVLLVSSGLMIRTFQALRTVDPGFVEPATLQTLRISISETDVREPADVMRMEQAILDRLAAVPGVSRAALTSVVPMTRSGRQDPIFAEDHVYSEAQVPPIRRFKFVSPGLLATMGNRLVAGRDFTWTDLYDMRPVVMVSENLARELWGDPSRALGKRVRESLSAPWREVVGVVGDERDDGVNQKAPPIVFWPLMMNDFSGDRVAVRRTVAYMVRSSRAGSSSVVGDLERAVWAINPNLPVAEVRTMREVYDRSLARTSFTLVMLAIAGGMALLLGIAGIYGVISYVVSQRTREIGIRIALGARNAEVVRMFVRHGMRLAAAGVLAGLVVAAVVMRFMASLLFDVRPIDPLTYGIVALALVAAATLASYVPALRASSVDPVESLRAE